MCEKKLVLKIMKELKPYISPSKTIPEFTFTPILVGSLLGILFGASSLYLTLKVGMTVSASIPVAVLSITGFKYFSKIFNLRKTTILENNIVQTAGSAGESIAFGVGVTMPTLLILGHEMELWRTTMVALLGALMGILMMIPLRRALIVETHGELAFPEGTACAEVLIVGEKGGTSAKTVFAGFFFGLIYKVLNIGAKLWTDVPMRLSKFFNGAHVACEVSPELLGVGYILGMRVSCIMVGGGILSAWMLIPAIKLFGGGLTAPLFPATKLISEMSPHDVWYNYVLYIGAGAVATAGIFSLIRNLPLIIHSAKAGLSAIRAKGAAIKHTSLRTDRDIPMQYVIGGILLLVAVINMVPSLHMNFLGSILIIVLGFLFVTVSSRLTGEVGSSSNPVSGMTVATLLVTSLLFLMMGWTSPTDRVTALSVAAIVCIACSNAGTTTQDLKTGQLVGATPIYQQYAILIGSFVSAIVIGFVLNLLNDAGTVYTKKNLPEGAVISNVAELKTEHLKGPDAKNDPNEYHVLRLNELASEGPLTGLVPGKYLVNDSGNIVYFADPGINGTVKFRDDGTEVKKYDAPKARLMSLIIDGILNRKLPWGLIMLGVAIAIVLELSGASTLAFAVGVYLPLAATMPIFFGGLIRWIVQRLSDIRANENDDSSPGILYSTGLIAGGSITGIIFALLIYKEEWLEKLDLSQVEFLKPIVTSNWTAIVMFAVMMGFLFKTATRKKA